MPSLVARSKVALEEAGECVVQANLESGWFAINPNTWKKRTERCSELGSEGPNLVVYRTESEEERDHHVIPNGIVLRLLTPESLKLQKNGTYRWNLTLSNDRLHVSHRKGYENVGKYLANKLVTESDEEGILSSLVANDRVVLRTRSYEGIVEGIMRESVVLSRSRSSILRREALRISGGTCACCAVNFSLLLNGKGLRALQVHQRNS